MVASWHDKYQGGNHDGEMPCELLGGGEQGKGQFRWSCQEDLEGRTADVDVKSLGNSILARRTSNHKVLRFALLRRERRQEWLELGETMT